MAIPRIIEEDQVSGILAIGGGDVTDHLLHRIDDLGMPLVTVDNQSNSRMLNNVVVDNYYGAYAATHHLIQLGHKRIAFIQGPKKYKSLNERFAGYLHAMFDANLSVDPSLIQKPISSGIPRKGRLEMLELLTLPQPPTAVFAVSDRSALGALDAIYEMGLTVPNDISIIGFDDIPPDAYRYPALSTITSERYEMGQIAVRRLHEIIEGRSQPPLKIVMPVKLIVRSSTLS